MILAKYYIEVTMAEIIARVDMIFSKNDVDIKGSRYLRSDKISSQPKYQTGRSE